MRDTRPMMHTSARTARWILTMAVCSVLSVVSVPTASAQQSAPARKPNIVVLWGDDIGYWNISAYNQGMTIVTVVYSV